MIPAAWSRATRWRTAASDRPSSRPMLVKGRRPSRCRAATMRRSTASTLAVLDMRTTSRFLCQGTSFEVVYRSLDVRRREAGASRSVISMGRRPDQERIDSLTKARTQLVHERTPKSREWRERSLASLPLGVASSFQDAPPYPIFFERAKGSRVWDVDGNEYADYHNGFGVMAVGHSHPKIVEALSERAAIGTHFAQPVAETTLLAEELCRRFRIDQMRFTNSGTEATMDAIRLARGVTGRDKIVKIEGSYHGHHESVLVSIRPSRDKMGPRETPASVEFGSGTPKAVTELTLIVPYNDAEALDRLLAANAGEVAGMIMEPVMMNVGIIDPEPGYLEAVREICSRHGVILIFDEVKTGATIAYGGAEEVYGVAPDLKCFAKAVGGGTPLGGFGGRGELMAEIAKDGVPQLGTFNGNPLCARAGLVALTEVLSYLSWLYEMTEGVFMTPGIDEQWTLSVQHTDEDVARYVNAFETFAKEVTGS